MNSYRLSEDAALTVIDFDLNGSGTGTLTDVGMTFLDMSEYDRVFAVYVPTVATGKVQEFRLVGSAASTGTSPVAIVAHGSGTPTVGATGGATGYMKLETSADEIAAIDDTIRYVGVQISFANGANEGRLFILRHGARYKQANKIVSLDS